MKHRGAWEQPAASRCADVVPETDARSASARINSLLTHRALG
jgi:hypothetical protein